MSEEQNQLPELCPYCGSELDVIEPCDDPTILSEFGKRCRHCGWSVVGTYSSPLLNDNTCYTVFVCKDEKPSKDLLQFLSRNLQLGLLDVKRMVLSGDVIVSKGSALEAYRVQQQLSAMNLSYYVIPAFAHAVSAKQIGDTGVLG